MIDLILTLENIYIEVDIENAIEKNIIILWIINFFDNCKYNVEMKNNIIIVEKDEEGEIYNEMTELFNYIQRVNSFYMRKKI